MAAAVHAAVAAMATLSFDPLPPRPASAPQTVRVHNLWRHQVPYVEALAWQRHLLADKVEARKQQQLARKQGGGTATADDVLIVLQHPPVLTLGTSSTLDNVRSDTPPFDIVRTERGGEVTYHGPGQLVLYPLLDLREYRQDVHWYMRALEEVVIRTLHDFGLPAGREEGLTGVWVDDAKACACGVKLSRWVSMHGLALNVAPDLAHFEHIVPCGISDKAVTSIARELHLRGIAPPIMSAAADEGGGSAAAAAAAAAQTDDPTLLLLDAAQRRLLTHFADVFEVELAIEEEMEGGVEVLQQRMGAVA